MAEEKSMRLSQVAKILNKGLSSVASSLSAKGFKVEINPNTKINTEQLEVLAKEYKSTELLNGTRRAEPPVAAAEPPRRQEEDVVLYRRDDARRPNGENKPDSAPADLPKPAPEEQKPEPQTAQTGLPGLKVVGKIDLNAKPAYSQPTPQAKAPAPQEVKQAVVTPAVAPPAPAVAVEAPKPVAAPTPPAPVAPPVAVETPKPAPTPSVEAKPVPTPPVSAPVVAEPQANVAKVDTAPKETPKPVIVESTPASAPPKAVAEQPTVPAPVRQEEAKPAVQERQRENRPAANSQPKPEAQPAAKPAPADEPEAATETIRAAGSHQLGGLKILGKIELPVNNPRQGGGGNNADKKGKRKRIRGGREGGSNPNQPNQGGSQPQGQAGNRPPREGDRGPANRTQGDRPQGDRAPATGQREAAPRDGNRQQGQGQGDRTAAPANRAGGTGTGQNQGGNNANRGGTGNNTNTTNNNRSGGGTGNNANRSGNNANRGGTGNNANRGGTGRREAPTQADVQKSIQQTNARMRGNTPNRGADRRRDRRSQREDDRRLMNEQEELEAKILKVTEFVSANDLASLMDVSINEVISVCLNLGMFVSINQRLDAEAITVIADEFGYDVQFISAEDETEASIDVEADEPGELQPRAPIVTIMGHVDHGKTSLLDYIRRAKVAAGEAGGITQHIGAYSVKHNGDRMITFLDTPGHEAFTAMRARGAKVTDVVIIVIAADDSIMPQTREAINHAQVAGVPIVFAFSKVDKPGADTEKIRTELAAMNMLVEEWGGKYQAQ